MSSAVCLLGQILFRAAGQLENFLSCFFRNAGVGAGSMLARIGGIFATTLPTLSEKVDERLPPILFGCAAFISAFLTTFLPETGGQPLPKDVDEIKAREEDDRRNGTWTKLKRATTRS